MYTPLTATGRNYATVGYWFASGIWWEHKRTQPWTRDHSSAFAEYCARRRDEYEAGGVTYLPSVPDLWEQFSAEIVFAPPTEATRASADQCEAHGLDPTGRFHP